MIVQVMHEPSKWSVGLCRLTLSVHVWQVSMSDPLEFTKHQVLEDPCADSIACEQILPFFDKGPEDGCIQDVLNMGGVSVKAEACV